MDQVWEKLVLCPMNIWPHLTGWRWPLTHQFGRNFVHIICVLANTFHHSNRKFIASDIQPFLLEIPFGLSKFGSNQGKPLDKGSRELHNEGVVHEERSHPPMLIGTPTSR
jgi:hypothetical protein